MKKWIGLLLVAAVAFYFMREAKAEVKNLHNSGANIVAFGDSLTAGFGAPKGSSYPDFLARKVNMPVINLGRSGETGAEAPARLDTALSQNPYMVLIEFGGNDFMRGVDPSRTFAAVEEMVDRVQRAGAVAVIVNTGGYPGMGAYTKAYKRIAAEKQAVFVPGILDGIFGKTQYKADTVHPNAEGYKIVADKVYEAIEPYLKK